MAAHERSLPVPAKILVGDNYGHEWVVEVDLSAHPHYSDDAYAECDQAALEAANVSWSPIEGDDDE